MRRCRRPLARRARTRRPQLRRGPAAWSAIRTSASQQNWLLMNRHNHGAPGSRSKRKQDDDKRSDFHGTPQAVNHEHERGAGRLITSRRRVVGRQSQPEQPLSTHVRQKSPVSDFLGAFGCRSSGIGAGCCIPATTPLVHSENRTRATNSLGEENGAVRGASAPSLF
jgi:hypothetical protein